MVKERLQSVQFESLVRLLLHFTVENESCSKQLPSLESVLNIFIPGGQLLILTAIIVSLNKIKARSDE